MKGLFRNQEKVKPLVLDSKQIPQIKQTRRASCFVSEGYDPGGYEMFKFDWRKFDKDKYAPWNKISQTW